MRNTTPHKISWIVVFWGWYRCVALSLVTLLSITTSVAQQADPKAFLAEATAQLFANEDQPLVADFSDALIQHEDLMAPLTPHCTHYSTRKSLLAANSWGTLQKLPAPDRYLIGRFLGGRAFNAYEFSIFEVRDHEVSPLHYQQYINGLQMQFNNYDWDTGIAQTRHRRKVYLKPQTKEVDLLPGTLDAISLLVKTQLELRRNQGYITPTNYHVLYKGAYRTLAVKMARDARVTINTPAGRLHTVELTSTDVHRQRVDRLWLSEELDYLLVWALRSSPLNKNEQVIVKLSKRLPVSDCKLPSSITDIPLMHEAE